MSSTNDLKHEVAKGFFWGGMSNAICQLLSLLFGVFLARLLGPADYAPVGMLAIFSAIAGSLQDSGFVSAIANRKNVTHDDYNAVFWFNILISFAMYGVLFFCAPAIAEFFGEPALVSLSRYIFLGFVVAGFGIAPSAYLFRELKVKERAIASMLSISISGLVGIVMAVNGYSYWGIATQSIMYVFVRSIVNWYFTPWRPSFKVNFAPLHYLFAFSYRLLITNIFMKVNWNAFSMILGRGVALGHCRSVDVGNYTKAAEWLTMGSEVVNGMVNGLAQPVFTRVADDRERQLRVFRKMLRFTIFISAPLLLGLVLVAPQLIEIVITDRWLESAYMLQILAVWGALMPVQSIFTNLLVSRGRTRTYMWCTIVQGSLILAMLYIALPYGINRMLAAYVVFNFAWLFLWRYFVWREIGLTLYMFLRDMLPFLLISAFVMTGVYYMTLSISNIYALFAVRVAAAAVLYVAILGILGNSELREAWDFICSKLKRKQ